MLCGGHIVGTLQCIGVLNGRIGIIIGKKQGLIFCGGQRRIPPLIQICIRGIDKLITKGNDSMIAVVGKNGSSIPAQLPHGIGNRDIALRIGGIQRQTVGIDHNRHSRTRTVVALIRNVYNPGLLRVHFRKNPEKIRVIKITVGVHASAGIENPFTAVKIQTDCFEGVQLCVRRNITDHTGKIIDGRIR